MVRDTLKKALEDAVGYYNSGMSADDAVVKAASDHDLTPDQTDRVVESFNTAKTINYFDKNAEDRTGSFDLASKKNVTLKLYGDAPEKKASANVRDPDVLGSSFYGRAPDQSYNRQDVFARKRADFLDAMAKVAEEKWSHGYSDTTLQAMASDALSTIKAAEADIDSAISTIDSYLRTATGDIADSLARGSYDTPKDRADLFKVACPHDQVVKEVSKMSPLLKAADGGIYRKMEIVDTTPVDDLLKEAADIMNAVEERKMYRQKKAEFVKKEQVLKSALMKDPSLSKYASSKAEDFIHRPDGTQKVAQDSVFSPDNLFGIVYDGTTRKKDNERVRDDTRGAILADLLSSDPILQDADPRQVASIYKSIVASSPRVSLNKEVVRSVLRGAVNSIAVSPSDVKVLTDVDKGVQQAFGGIKKDEVD